MDNAKSWALLPESIAWNTAEKCPWRRFLCEFVPELSSVGGNASPFEWKIRSLHFCCLWIGSQATGSPKLEKDIDALLSYWRKTHWGKLTSSEMELGTLFRRQECPSQGGSGLWGQSCSEQLAGCPLWSWSIKQFMNLKHISQPYGIFLMVCSQQSSLIIVNRCSFCPISQGIKINVMFEHECFPTHCWSCSFP